MTFIRKSNFTFFNNLRGILSYRINFYFNTAWEQLVKFKYLLILLLGMLTPSVTAFFHLLQIPYLFVLLPASHPVWEKILTLAIILTVYLGWILIQRNAVMGGVPRNYFMTFPFHKTEWFIVDVIMIVIANNLLWLPLFAVLMHPPQYYSLFYLSFNLLFLSILLLQYIFLRKIPAQKIKISLLPLVLNIHFSIFWRKEKIDTLIKSGISIALTVALYFIATRTSFNAFSIIIFFVGVMHYLFSGWYRKLKTEHQKYLVYFQQFSYYKLFIFMSDIIFIFLHMMLIQFPLLILLFLFNSINLAQLLAVIFYQIFLILLLYILENKFNKPNYIWPLLLITLWVYCAI
jgi:hypothetical protein